MAKNIVIDVEADGPCPGLYSMVSFGAAAFKDGEIITFYSGILKPVSENWIPDALKVSGATRKDMEKLGRDPSEAIKEFATWLDTNFPDKKYLFWSDNVAFDWQFMNYYFYAYNGSNPFGFSGRRIGDLYAGIVKDTKKGSEWKKFRKTKHDHNPANDAKGNLEALDTILGMIR